MKNKLVSAAFKSATVSILFLTVVTICAEFSVQLKSFLANLTGHHWTAKGMLGAILFVALIVLFNATGKEEDVSKSISIAITTTVTGMVALLVFYVIHYFS